MKYAKPQRIILKDHADVDERWVQERIAEVRCSASAGELVKDAREVFPAVSVAKDGQKIEVPFAP